MKLSTLCPSASTVALKVCISLANSIFVQYCNEFFGNARVISLFSSTVMMYLHTVKSSLTEFSRRLLFIKELLTKQFLYGLWSETRSVTVLFHMDFRFSI